MKEYKEDNLVVRIFSDKNELGKAAALSVADSLISAISEKDNANLILATGASQFQLLKYLQQYDINWEKITVFHLDEYLGLPEPHPASFQKYLNERILDKVKAKKVYFINGHAPDTEAEVMRYENLLREYPADVACIGIGENGHLAFNDPSVADFNDSKLVKVVELEESSRMQQLKEGWFTTLEEVPKQAITLTIPALMSSKSIHCAVPGGHKAEAVYNTLRKDISTLCPASILRNHPNAVVYLDEDSASKL
jgi:glucosamine-6-phosphate deaminase